MLVVAFIHAKEKSDRLTGKNLRPLGGKPLFVYAIDNALKAKLVDKVIIDSDSDEILKIGQKYGAIPLKRDKSLATNKTTGDDLMVWQTNSEPDADIVLQVVPTSPFTKPDSIDGAIEKLIELNVNSVVGVRKQVFYQWKNGKPAYRIKGHLPNSYEMEPWGRGHRMESHLRLRCP